MVKDLPTPPSLLRALDLSFVASEAGFDPPPPLVAAWSRAVRECTFALLCRVTEDLRREVQSNLHALGITLGDLQALELLRAGGRLTVRRLAGELNCADLDLRLGPLFASQAIVRIRSGPHTYVALTVLGHALHSAAVEARDAALEACYSSVSEEELRALLLILGLLSRDPGC